MTVTYLPHRLIHAHLPAPPLIPNAIPELRVATSRPFPESDDDFSSPLHEDHAVSSVHSPHTNLLLRSIRNGYCLEIRNFSLFISKQRNPRQDGAGSETLRIAFPDPLLPLVGDCVVANERTGKVTILVASEASVVYRLVFPLGGFRGSKGERLSFRIGGERWCEEWEVPDEVLSASGGFGAWEVVDENTMLLGGNDGGIVKVVRSKAGHWTASQHRTSSRLRLPSLFSRSGSDEQIVSFAQFHHEHQLPVTYSLSRDRKLRTWNTSSGACLRTTDVRASSANSRELVIRDAPPSSSGSSFTPLPDNSSACLIRVVHHPSPTSRYSHLVIVFLATPHSPTSAGSFVVFRGSNSAHAANDLVYAGERPASSFSAGSELRGFEILPPVETGGISSSWRLWATWDKKGSIQVESIPMDDLFQFTTYIGGHHASPLLHDWQTCAAPINSDPLDPAYFDNLLPLQPPNPTDPHDNADIPSTFISHLFHPGRFSQLTLQSALEDYISAQIPKKHVVPPLSAADPTLARRYEGIVGCMLQMKESAQTGGLMVEEYRKELKLHWLGVWAAAVGMDKQARWPVNIALVDGQIVVLSREGITSPLPLDAPGLIQGVAAWEDQGKALITLPEGALRDTYPMLAPPQARSSAVTIALAGSSLADSLAKTDTTAETVGGNALSVFVEAANAQLATVAEQPIEDIAGGLWDDFIDPYLAEDDRIAIRRILSDCPDLVRGLSTTLSLLSDWSLNLSSTRLGDLAWSGAGNALVTSAITSVISARYTVARSILLVALYHLSETDPEQIESPDDQEEQFDILARVLATYHRYRVLKWLSEQNGHEAVVRGLAKKAGGTKRKQGGEDMLPEFGKLGVREGSGASAEDSDGFEVAYSLLHSLLARRTPQEVLVGSADAVHGAALAWLDSADLLQDGQTDTEPQAADTRLAQEILLDGHSELAGSMTELYSLSAGMAYIRGRSRLECGQLDVAVDLLLRAAAGVKDGSLGFILPSCTGPKGFTEYYRHVTRLFEEQGCDVAVVRFGQLAIESSAPGNPSNKDLWTKVLLANLSLGLFEDAYTILTRSPHLDMRRDLLGQLISVMCESNEVGRLNSLGFVGFQELVEQLLDFKARNSDPLRFPNYYKVLYAWHIARGDYRSAGEIMYKQGRRLGDSSSSKVPAFELAAMQARSYLAAINALSLVDKRNAWVAIQAVPGKPVRGNKKRRISSYIPEEEFARDKPAVEIVTLEDIKAVYTSVLSHLQLASQIPDLHEQGITISPEEVVGLFVQRGMFDLAHSAASTLQVDMTDLFRALAERCVELSRTSALGIDPSSASFLHSSPLTSRLRGPPSALALRYLQISLSRHDSAATRYRYRETVADALFELNQDKKTGWKMPEWLVQWEMERDPEGWISRAVRWGWVEEAVDWAMQVLRGATPPELLPRGKADVADLPYNLIDRVLAAANEGDEKDDVAVQSKAKALRDEVEWRKSGLQKLSGRR